MKAQKRSTCRTCDGPIHFYPHLASDGEPVLDENDQPVGDWAHLRPADWINNAHAVDPAEEAQAS